MSGAHRPADLAEEAELPCDDFRLAHARLEILSIAGQSDLIALCLAKRPEQARIAGTLNPGSFCGMVMALAEREVWPSEARRRTAILEVAAGGVVLWLYRETRDAQAALPMLAARGAAVLR